MESRESHTPQGGRKDPLTVSLAATVYYVYYQGDALAAGFGSWLGSAGQKAFERSSLAPYRLVERTIILK